jgi:hypothetical protein
MAVRFGIIEVYLRDNFRILCVRDVEDAGTEVLGIRDVADIGVTAVDVHLARARQLQARESLYVMR